MKWYFTTTISMHTWQIPCLTGGEGGIGWGRGEKGGVGKGEIRQIFFSFFLNKLKFKLFTFCFILLIQDIYWISSVQSLAGHGWVRLWLQTLCLLKHFYNIFFFSFRNFRSKCFQHLCIKVLWKVHRYFSKVLSSFLTDFWTFWALSSGHFWALW